MLDVTRGRKKLYLLQDVLGVGFVLDVTRGGVRNFIYSRKYRKRMEGKGRCWMLLGGVRNCIYSRM